MNDAKKAALAAIDEKKELVAEVADAIWYTPTGSLTLTLEDAHLYE